VCSAIGFGCKIRSVSKGEPQRVCSAHLCESVRLSLCRVHRLQQSSYGSNPLGEMAEFDRRDALILSSNLTGIKCLFCSQ